FIPKKSREEFTRVLAPKVIGTVNLDQATCDLELDFFILFSSGAGALGNPGQADYAAANAFMDAYTGYRNQLSTTGKRHGVALSINWPLWKDGGMQVGRAFERIIKDKTGMKPMETAAGIKALGLGLGLNQSRLMVVNGDPEKIRKSLLEKLPADETGSSKSDAHVLGQNLEELTLEAFKSLIGKAIDLVPDRLDAKKSFETYGIDSVMIAQLNQDLEIIFGDIPKTLFYEFQTLESLAMHLSRTYPGACMAWTQCTDAKIPFAQPMPVPSKKIKIISKKTISQTAVAIIGLSGRYPKADTIEDYW
ncbi:MAG: KR domain-containing protein, partial [Desulfobacteraceae bacterium]|nr:KR domain-containing protein [Desulfobacteraceae bacterium]